MLVYHGTIEKIDKPLVNFSKRHLDFGVGFYVTKNKDLAEKWSKRKKDLNDADKSIVNVYELNEEYVNYKYLNFKIMDKKWLDFVCKCRKESDEYKNYDVIEGPIANDKVFTAVDLYRREIWDADKTIKELSFIENAYQICILKQEIVDNKLKFVEYYEV